MKYIFTCVILSFFTLFLCAQEYFTYVDNIVKIELKEDTLIRTQLIDQNYIFHISLNKNKSFIYDIKTDIFINFEIINVKFDGNIMSVLNRRISDNTHWAFFYNVINNDIISRRLNDDYSPYDNYLYEKKIRNPKYKIINIGEKWECNVSDGCIVNRTNGIIILYNNDEIYIIDFLENKNYKYNYQNSLMFNSDGEIYSFTLIHYFLLRINIDRNNYIIYK